MSNQSNVKAAGFVLPYCHGGSESNNGHPVLLVPVGQPAPAGSSRTVYSAKERPEDIIWAQGPTVEINGVKFDTYGAQGGKKYDKAQAMLDTYLGDSFQRASKEEAVAIIAKQAADQFKALITNARKMRPDLANVPDAELLAALVKG